MTKIVDISLWRRLPDKHVMPQVDGTTAEIVIFSGVRYERWAEVAPRTGDGGGRGRRRGASGK
jgi:hypothetical protein